MNWLDKLERKYRKFGVAHLISYIIGGNIIVLLLSLADQNIVQLLYFDLDKILSGEVWRLVSFIIIPPPIGIFIVFALYLEYTIGTNLELEWGTFKFNFYFFFGVFASVVGAILAKVIFGADSIVFTNHYLSLTLFFAFATLFPDFRLMLFFVFSIKIKYLGYLSWAILGITALFMFNLGEYGQLVLIFFSILNYLVFFSGDIIRKRMLHRKAYKRKQEFRTSNRINRKATIHQCEVCKRTELDDKDLVFRYCSKCNGDYEYCQDHLHNHEHK